MSELFADQWLWLIFVGVGCLLIIGELLAGIDTGFDFVFVGLAFVLAGVIGLIVGPWEASVIALSVAAVGYFLAGRRYVKRWVQTRETKTNVDAIIGRTALVVKPIGKFERGRVKIDGVLWRAGANEDIEEGAEVAINGVRGSTLLVSRQGGGQQ